MNSIDADFNFSNQASGCVHSSYTNTVNLVDGAGKFSALARGNRVLTHAPRTIVLDSADFPVVTAGQKWRISNEKLHIGSWNLALSSLPRRDCHIAIAPVSPLRLGEAAAALAKTGPIPAADPFSMHADQLALERFHKLTKAVIAADETEISSGVQQLIGLGSGLTPIGDDLVSGMLLALHCSDSPRKEVLARAVHSCLERTNPISAAFLQDAIAGKARSEVQLFYQALCDQTQPLLPALEAILSLGHSSGPALALAIVQTLK